MKNIIIKTILTVIILSVGMLISYNYLPHKKEVIKETEIYIAKEWKDCIKEGGDFKVGFNILSKGITRNTMTCKNNKTIFEYDF